MSRRELSDQERRILALIQVSYGAHNAEQDVHVDAKGDATIWVKDRAGALVLMVNITNLGVWIADGTIPTEAELLRDWLRVEGS